jgi:hypothetical protein
MDIRERVEAQPLMAALATPTNDAQPTAILELQNLVLTDFRSGGRWNWYQSPDRDEWQLHWGSRTRYL